MDNTKNNDYETALYLFESGYLDNSKSLINKILEQNDSDYEALYLNGVLLFTENKIEEAVNNFKKAMDIFPDFTEAIYSLGLCYQSLDKLTLAEECYNKVLSLNDKHSDALNNLGLIYYNTSRIIEAEDCYKKAIALNPTNMNPAINLANVQLHNAKYSVAEYYYQMVLRNDPTNETVLFNLGVCNSQQSKTEEALLQFEKVLQINPENIGALNNAGICFMKLDNFNQAKIHFNKLLQLNPYDAVAYYNLGYCCQSEKNNEAAIDYYQKAMECDPNIKAAILNIGSIYREKGDLQKSEEFLNAEFKDNDSKVFFYTNYAVAKMRKNMVDESIKFLRMALEVNDSYPESHFNLGCALLKDGQFTEGWREYEWRKKRKDFKNYILTKPPLVDQNIEGKTILVNDEQGAGDTFQFARYLKLLKTKGCKIVFVCNPSVYKVCESIEGYDEIIPVKDAETPDVDYDYHISLLSLPYYFNTGKETIPNETPYIFADKEKVKLWQKIIGNSNNIKVGIVWAGNPKHNNDKRRSCPLNVLAEISSLEGVDVYSLQKGYGLHQLADIKNEKIKVFENYILDFSDTAAIIENMDLVISVDTSVAHLAGAMNKNIWTILPFSGEWRWLTNRDDSPWYPSMRIFRQPRENDWKSVVDLLIKELKQISGNVLDSTKSIVVNQSPANLKKQDTLYLGLSKGENFGWGVCSTYLKKELSKIIPIVNIDEDAEVRSSKSADGKIFHALTNLKFDKLFDVQGKENYGYTFFENELEKEAVENSRSFDVVIGGSTWCCTQMNKKGIYNTGTLIQGIDPQLFYPNETQRKDNLFVIFSGGKFELRKGQDLVLRAVKALQEKYSDIVLINAWYNNWPQSMATMSHSKYINFDLAGENWAQFMDSIIAKNGMDKKRIISLPLTPQTKLREIYEKTDLGLFPNRCEGGTNLVMMEYMACGKPVVASYNTGHTDILNQFNSYPLMEMKPFRLFDSNNHLTADWEEPCLDEIIAKIEFAYQNRQSAKVIGKNAGEFMKNFTWTVSAEKLLEILKL